MKRKYLLENALMISKIVLSPLILGSIIFNDYLLAIIFLLVFNVITVIDAYPSSEIKIETKFLNRSKLLTEIITIIAIIIILILKHLVGLINISLFIVSSLAFTFIIIMHSKKKKELHLPTRASGVMLLFITYFSIYTFLFQIGFADILLLFTFTAIFFYTIPDYILQIWRVEEKHKWTIGKSK